MTIANFIMNVLNYITKDVSTIIITGVLLFISLVLLSSLIKTIESIVKVALILSSLVTILLLVYSWYKGTFSLSFIDSLISSAGTAINGLITKIR